MSVIEFPQGSRCYACFDFATGTDHLCPACGRSTGSRLPPEKRPSRPATPIVEYRLAKDGNYYPPAPSSEGAEHE